MTINVRQKGQTGERDIADDLNAILRSIYAELEMSFPDKPIVQRNQNQSAVGGSDLSGTYGLAIEVKRQEALSINTWWAQCLKAATENKEDPVLLFRQNKQKWRCMLFVDLPVPGRESTKVRAEITYEDFKHWFRQWAYDHIVTGKRMGSAPGPVEESGVMVAPTRDHGPDLYAQ